MSLSITNHISKQEIAALAHCNLSSELIAIKMDAEGGLRIVTPLQEERCDLLACLF